MCVGGGGGGVDGEQGVSIFRDSIRGKQVNDGGEGGGVLYIWLVRIPLYKSEPLIFGTTSEKFYV